jgi:hypothetical protein
MYFNNVIAFLTFNIVGGGSTLFNCNCSVPRVDCGRCSSGDEARYITGAAFGASGNVRPANMLSGKPENKSLSSTQFVFAVETEDIIICN